MDDPYDTSRYAGHTQSQNKCYLDQGLIDPTSIIHSADLDNGSADQSFILGFYHGVDPVNNYGSLDGNLAHEPRQVVQLKDLKDNIKTLVFPGILQTT